MKSIGKMIIPDNPNTGLHIKEDYYAIRYNPNKGYMSNKPLGLQVLTLFLGSYMWINIDERWLV